MSSITPPPPSAPPSTPRDYKNIGVKPDGRVFSIAQENLRNSKSSGMKFVEEMCKDIPHVVVTYHPNTSGQV